MGIKVQGFLTLPENYYVTINKGKKENDREYSFSTSLVPGACIRYLPEPWQLLVLILPLLGQWTMKSEGLTNSHHLGFSPHAWLLWFALAIWASVSVLGK